MKRRVLVKLSLRRLGVRTAKLMGHQTDDREERK